MVAQAILPIDWLPSGALDAAAEFHESWLDQALELLESDCDALAVVMPPAPADHSDWRRAVVRDLARDAAPKRVNALAGNDQEAIDATLAFLADAPGVTGQLFLISGHAAPHPAR